MRRTLSRRGLFGLALAAPVAAVVPAVAREPEWIGVDLGAVDDVIARVIYSASWEAPGPMFTMEHRYVGNFATFAEMNDAPLRVGEWATCHAEGLVRIPEPFRMSDADLARTLGIGESDDR